MFKPCGTNKKVTQEPEQQKHNVVMKVCAAVCPAVPTGSFYCPDDRMKLVM